MMTPPRKPNRWRWPHRIALVLLAGVLLTVASTWVLQWRAFPASAAAGRWWPELSGYYLFPEWRYAGDGVYKAFYRFDFDSHWTRSAPPDIHHVPDLPWYVVEFGESTYIRRNEWDTSAAVHRTLEPPDHPMVCGPSAQSSRHPEFARLSRATVPNQAIQAEPLKSDWYPATQYFDIRPGWFAGSSFRASRDESLHALHRPVERWSAQRAGWPAHAMMTEQYAIGTRPPIERIQDMPLASLRHGIKGGLILHHQPQHPMLHPLGHHSLPLLPLWPGFALNTAFYAACTAALWLALATAHHLLSPKRRRRARGQCEACGYDLTGLTTCPECGRPGILATEEQLPIRQQPTQPDDRWSLNR